MLANFPIAQILNELDQQIVNLADNDSVEISIDQDLLLPLVDDDSVEISDDEHLSYQEDINQDDNYERYDKEPPKSVKQD